MPAPVENPTRAALVWGGLLVVVVAGFFVTVAILNATVYSAPGFVKGYLAALDRGDTASALSLADVQPTSDDVLLTVPEKGMLDDVSVTDDRSLGGGAHLVAVSFVAGGARHRAEFTLEPASRIAGLFTGWGFRAAPTASLDITPSNDPRFIANGVDIRSKSADLATRYTVLAPAVFSLTHDTTYLTAAAQTVVVPAPGQVGRATVATGPKQSFVEKVRTDVTKYLRSTCVPQKVLLPAGCPFGQQVDDRLTSSPEWSMTAFPPVALRPTDTPGVWLVAKASGKAHLQVGAQSLYDGHTYRIDEDVPFTVEYLVTIGSDNGLTITPR